jgi:3-dehydroquinate synthetase
MDPLIRIVTIKLDPRSYPVHIGENLLDETGRICRGALLKGRAVIVSDRKVGELYGERVSNALAYEGFKVSNHLVNPGELSKSFEVAAMLCEDFAAMELTGKALLPPWCQGMPAFCLQSAKIFRSWLPGQDSWPALPFR